MDKDIVLKKLLWKFWQIGEIELNQFIERYNQLLEQEDESIFGASEEIKTELLEFMANSSEGRQSPYFISKSSLFDWLLNQNNIPKLKNKRQSYSVHKRWKNDGNDQYFEQVILHINEFQLLSLIEYIGKEKGINKESIANINKKYNFISSSLDEINAII